MVKKKKKVENGDLIVGCVRNFFLLLSTLVFESGDNCLTLHVIVYFTCSVLKAVLPLSAFPILFKDNPFYF